MYIMYSQSHFIKKNLLIIFLLFLQSKIQKVRYWLQLLLVHVSMIAPLGLGVYFVWK
jgi:hypothetical protein